MSRITTSSKTFSLLIEACLFSTSLGTRTLGRTHSLRSVLSRCSIVANSLNLHLEDAIHAQRRYSTHFGPLNSETSISNHTFVFINAPGLVEEDYQRARHHQDYETYTAPAGGTVDFLRLIDRQRDG